MKPVYDDPARSIPSFKEIYEAESLDWAVIGGLAAIERRSEGRDTVDADFVISEIGNLQERLTSMNPRWFQICREPDGNPYPVQGETRDGMHFDIYVAGIDFEKAVLDTKDENHIASAEAIIVYELMAMRPVDVDDIRSILADCYSNSVKDRPTTPQLTTSLTDRPEHQHHHDRLPPVGTRSPRRR